MPGYTDYYVLKEQEEHIKRLEAIQESLKDNALKWMPGVVYGWDFAKGEMPDWNEEEVPTKEYLESVEIQRDMREI